MDQGSYSRPDGRGQPTLPGSSGANNNYQVNVSRQKTKKWVEAKSQNYDGDDWGADEYDDDEVEPPLPLSPRVPQYAAPNAAPNVPSLHVQTSPSSQPQQHQPYPPPQSRPPPPATAQPRHESDTPLSAHPSSAAPQSTSTFQPQSASSTYPLSPRSPPDSLPSGTPQAATAGKPLPFVRPSDIYRRMEEEKSRGSSESSRPSADFGSNLSKQSSASPARTAAQPVKPQPTSPPIPTPRTDSHTSVYQDLTKPSISHVPRQPSITSPPRSDPRVSQFVTPSRDATPNETGEEVRRLSTSPKLPDLARMSVFGADFFSGGFSSTLSSEQMAEQSIPDVPKVAPELKVDKPSTNETSTSSAEASKASTDKTQVASAAPAAMENAPIKHQVIEPTVYQPPTVAAKKIEPVLPATPTESKPAADPAKQAATRSSIDTASSARSAASTADVTPTKPLNVRKDDSPVRSFEPPPPLQREPTFGTDTSSPVKESDALRDEIIKTLNSPSQPSREGGETWPADSGRMGSQGHTRDSTYTLQDYDTYWADTDTAPQVPAQPAQAQPKTMSIVPEEATQTVVAAESEATSSKALEPSNPIEEVKRAASPPAHPSAASQPTPQVSTSQPSASPTVSQASRSTSAQQQPETSIVSPASADLRRRFSWEAEDASKASAAASGAAPPVATAPPPAPALAAVAAPVPAPAVATAAVPPTEPKPQPEIASPHASGASAPNAPGVPAVAVTDSISQESKRLSLADEKALSTTPSNEVSAPPDEHPTLSLSDPAPAPVLSMPRSLGASVTPFKDIVGLNNSSERVAKFNETRVAFAVMDIGLDKWLTTLHQDHPEHHSKSFNSYQPSVAPPAGVAPGAQAPAQQPYYQQYLNASAPGGGTSPGRRIGGITMPSNVGGSTFGHSGNQIGTKSKELMQSAGKMGKGLFSKGKNKLRGDKGDTHPQPVQAKAKHDRSGSWAVLSNKLRTEFSHGDPHHPEEDYSATPRPSVTIAPQIPEPEPVSPLLREASPDKSLPPVQTPPAARGNGFAVGSMSAVIPSTSHVPPSSQIRLVPSETTYRPAGAGAPVMSPPAAEDSGVGMLVQPEESDDAPKRQSSFVGLPPIRRSSTFGMKSKARRASERFPLDEEEGNGVPNLPTSDVMENAVGQADAPQQPYREHPAAPQTGPSFQAPDKDSILMQHQPVSAEHSPERHARQPAIAPPPQTQPLRQPVNPPTLMHPGQIGHWKLEESHLAEPLHQAKNRSGHSPISPPMGFGFEKETGQSAAMPPPPLPASNRQRNPDVPPSSAQRYPGLFAPRPGQEPQQRQPGPQAYYEEMVNPRHSINEYSIPGVGPPAEERGRAKRNSGIFREIGDKISRATSRDRNNSVAENQPPVEIYADDASESSFGMEEVHDRKKRRSSFLNTLTGRASVDQGPRQSLSALPRSQTEALPQSSSEDVGSARRRSIFSGVMAGFSVNKGGSVNAPTSGLTSQQATDEEPPLTPKKKRFSGIAKAFQRPNQDRPSSGMSLEATQSAGSSQGQNTRGGILSSIPSRNNERGGSAGQTDAAGAEHGRRSSFSNLLSTLTGNKAQQNEQQLAAPPRDMGGLPSSDLPRDIPPAPPQIHPADGFPTPNRDAAPAPTLPDQFLDRSQPLFAASENNWGIDRPPTSTTVKPREANVDVGGSIASSDVIVPDVSNPSLQIADASAKRDDHSAPSDVSDSETDLAESARKPSDVAPSATSRADEDGADIVRQDTNVSQVAPSLVTDTTRLDEQERTPTAQYPNSPGGYYTHNNRLPGAAPVSAGAQGYSQEQPTQHLQDPRRPLTGPAYEQSTGQPALGPHSGQHAQQPVQYLYQQQNQKHMQPGYGQPIPQARQAAASPKGWKGLKTKMAGQMASISQSSPNTKSERGDKPAPGDKLFGAFKRLSKQQPGGVSRGAQGGEESAGFRVYARNQGQPVASQSQQMPPKPMPPQQMQHQQMTSQQVPPQQMQMGQGLHPQQSVPQQHMSTHMQQQQQQPQQQQQQQGEPQYASVPIPQGYTAVYGHGSAQVPAMYNVGRQYSQHQTPYQQQQNYASHHQPYASVGGNQQQGNGFAPTQAQSSQHTQPEFQPESQHREHHSQRPSATGSDLLSPLSTTQRSGSIPFSPASDEPRSPHAALPTTHRSSSIPFEPASDEPRSPHAALTREALAQQDARKDLQAHHLHPEDGHTSMGPASSNRVSQVSNDSGRHGPSPKSEHSPTVSHKQLQAALSPASPGNERHVSAASISPPPVSSSPDVVSPRDDAAIPPPIEATAPTSLTSDLTGESKGQVSDDSLERKAKLDKPKATMTTATEHVAELEDTAEARQRTLRIDGQEEKIAYDPEEENPKMTATSYPGQEWNPYGEPGFTDWHE